MKQRESQESCRTNERIGIIAQKLVVNEELNLDKSL